MTQRAVRATAMTRAAPRLAFATPSLVRPSATTKALTARMTRGPLHPTAGTLIRDSSSQQAWFRGGGVADPTPSLTSDAMAHGRGDEVPRRFDLGDVAPPA